MNVISQIMEHCDSRYPSEEERRQVLDYAASMPRRMDVVERLEGLENTICQRAMIATRKAFPDLADDHDDQWTKTVRDHQLTLRVFAQAYLLDDIGYLDDKLLYWLRGVLASLGYGGEPIAFSYQALSDAARDLLGEADFEPLKPYFDRTIEVLRDLPLSPSVAGGQRGSLPS